jgi:preprotein translocase subunit SecY
MDGKPPDEDRKLWRIYEQRSTLHRSRWEIHRIVIIGALLLSLWALLGIFWGMWGSGLVLAPVGGFLLVWGIVQEILAHVSMESFKEEKKNQK